MANRYANLTPSAPISQEYQKITQGFDRVQSDVDNLNELKDKVDEILKGQDLDPNKDIEVLASRVSSQYGTFDTLPARLDHTDQILASFIEEVGNLEDLNTDEKSNLVGSINEVNTRVKSHLEESVHQGINNTVSVTSTDNATSTTDAPLKSAGGLAVAKDAHIGGSIYVNTNGEFLRSEHHREFYYTRLQGYSDLGIGQQLVWSTSLNSTMPFMFRVKFSGGYSTGAAGRIAVVDKLFAVAFGTANIFKDSESVTYLKIGFADADVTIVPTGVGNEIKIILKNPIAYGITRWSLLISTEASSSYLTSEPVLTIENV